MQCHQLTLVPVGTQCTQDCISSQVLSCGISSKASFVSQVGLWSALVLVSQHQLISEHDFAELQEKSLSFASDCTAWRQYQDRRVSEVLCCWCTSFGLLHCRICVAISCSLNWVSLMPFSLPSRSDVCIQFSVCTDDSEMPVYPTDLLPLCITSRPSLVVSLV